jgi:hypothetical protein
MESSGAGGKLIYEKKPEAKNLVTVSQTYTRLSSCQLASHIIVKYCIDNCKYWPRHIATNWRVGLFF